MLRKRLQEAIAHVGQALREPEEFTVRWHRGEVQYGWPVWAALIAMSMIGTIAYGMTMGILGGPARVLAAGQQLAAGSWLSFGKNFRTSAPSSSFSERPSMAWAAMLVFLMQPSISIRGHH